MGNFSRIYKTDLTDRQFMDFWHMVKASGRDRVFAYCLPHMDDEEFVNWMRKPDIHPWIISYTGVPVGMMMLTDRRGKTADVHFCTLPSGTRRVPGCRLGITRASGIFALAKCLWEKNKSGRYIVDTLIGYTPATNKQAVKFASSIGGTVAGRIPGHCFYYDTSENDDAICTYYTRESVPEWAAKL